VLIINVKITQADQALYGISNLYLPNLLQVDILRPIMNSAFAHNHHVHHHLLPERPEFFART